MDYNYYSINDFVKSEKSKHFHINKLSEQPPLPKNIKNPHKHRFYELFVITKGTMKHYIDFQEYTVVENSLIFISQTQLHMRIKIESELEGYRLMFTEEFFQLSQPNNMFLTELIFLDNVYNQPLIKINKQILNFFDVLYTEFNQENNSEIICKALIFIILAEIQRMVNQSNEKNYETYQILMYKKFIFLLEENYAQNHCIDDYANELNVTSSLLRKILKSVSGLNFSQIVQNRLLLEAKRLLYYSDLTIIQISNELGFNDSSYFTKFFHKNTGVNPLDFRKNCK